VAAELTGPVPCVLFALRRESHFFRRALPPWGPCPGAPCWARICGPREQPVLLAETGVGQARVGCALDWLLGTRPPWVLFAGFGGALADDLRVGDVVWATGVRDAEGRAWPTTWPGIIPAELRRGTLLTMPRIISTPGEKRALARQHGAVAVDMESALLARRCSELGVPFGCLRAISDDAATSLSPELARIVGEGTVAPWQFVAALARRPRLLGEMLRLARYTKEASRRLGGALGQLLSASRGP